MDNEVGRDVPQSVLEFMFESLGLFYGTVIPLAGFVVFVGAVLVVCISKRPSVVAAYLVFLPLPFLIGVFGSIHGLITSFVVISQYDSAPRANDITIAVSTSLFSSLAGLAVTFPSLFILAFGLFIRTICWRDASNR